MKILSINVSEPQKVVFNGKELITSIYKKPVSNKVAVSSQGIAVSYTHLTLPTKRIV